MAEFSKCCSIWNTRCLLLDSSKAPIRMTICIKDSEGVLNSMLLNIWHKKEEWEEKAFSRVSMYKKYEEAQ